MAAAISMITRLCSVGCPRKSEPNSPPLPDKTEAEQDSDSKHSSSPRPTTAETTTTTIMTPPSPQTAIAAESNNNPTKNAVPQIKELPLPPGKQMQLKLQQSFATTNNSSNNPYMSKSASTRNFITKTLSIKMPRSMSVSRNRGGGVGVGDDKKIINLNLKKKDKMKHQDSVWTKTIILGEKCRVPDEDEDDATVYDFKGNRISPYHPKAASRSVSRQSSHIDAKSIPSP